MIKVIITEDMLDSIRELHKSKKLYKGHSISEGKGRYWGLLGELIVMKALKKVPNIKVQHVSTFNHDLLINGKKVDVKTKIRKDKPRANFDGSIEKSATHQKPDYYIFVSIIGPRYAKDITLEDLLNYKLKEAYICGMITKKDFFEKATFFKKGSKDPSNGVVYNRDSCYILPYGKMDDPALVFKLERA